MISRDDVAKLAGVSGATVSYVLNDKPGTSVSERTRHVVRKAAKKLGYRPSLAGRALRMGLTRQIGIVTPSGHEMFSFYRGAMLRSAWRVVSERGYRLVLDAVVQERLTAFVADRAVDAIIMLALPPSAFPAESRRLALKQGLPVVMVGGGSWVREFHTLDINNVQLGRAAADCLTGRGHRRLIFFGGADEGVAVRLRRRGFRDRLKSLGIELPADNIIDTPFAEPDAGYEAGLDLLRSRRDFTAAFCHNDNLGAGLIRAAAEIGVRVPDQLSVLGVDAAPMGRFAQCRLASFRLPLEEMGEAAARLALDPPRETVHRYFPFQFEQGESVATIPS